jgi:hypothetical protein
MVIQRAIRLYSGETQRSSSNISRRNRLLCAAMSRKPNVIFVVDQSDVGKKNRKPQITEEIDLQQLPS